jgi:RNA-dependent RNA polymerase
MSREIANAIWGALRAARQRHGNKKRKLPPPAAYQIRFMGSKGMISVDYTLTGRAIGLRKSMIKFEAPDSRRIEIAQVFDKPGKYFVCLVWSS